MRRRSPGRRGINTAAPQKKQLPAVIPPCRMYHIHLQHHIVIHEIRRRLAVCQDAAHPGRRQKHIRRLLPFKKMFHLILSAQVQFAVAPMKEGCLLTGELEKTNEAYALAKISGLKLKPTTLATSSASSLMVSSFPSGFPICGRRWSAFSWNPGRKAQAAWGNARRFGKGMEETHERVSEICRRNAGIYRQKPYRLPCRCKSGSGTGGAGLSAAEGIPGMGACRRGGSSSILTSLVSIPFSPSATTRPATDNGLSSQLERIIPPYFSVFNFKYASLPGWTTCNAYMPRPGHLSPPLRKAS